MKFLFKRGIAIDYFGGDLLCGFTGTVFGPGLSPGPRCGGVDGGDRLYGLTGTDFGGICFSFLSGGSLTHILLAP